MWTRLSNTSFCRERGGNEYAEEDGSRQERADETTWSVAPLTCVSDFEGKSLVLSTVSEYKATMSTTTPRTAEQRRGFCRRKITNSERISQAQRLFKHEEKDKGKIFNEYQATCGSKETMGDQNFILLRGIDAVIIISQDNVYSFPALPCLSILAQQFDMKSANGKRWQWTTLGQVSSSGEVMFFLDAWGNIWSWQVDH